MYFSNSYAAQSFKIKLQNNQQCLFCNTNYWKRRYIGDSTECHCRSNFIGLFSCIFFLFCVFLLSSCNNLSNETVGYQNGIRWCLMMSFVCKVCTENALFKIYTNKNRYTMQCAVNYFILNFYVQQFEMKIKEIYKMMKFAQFLFNT